MIDIPKLKNDPLCDQELLNIERSVIIYLEKSTFTNYSELSTYSYLPFPYVLDFIVELGLTINNNNNNYFNKIYDLYISIGS